MKIAVIGNDYLPQFPLKGYGGIEICVDNLAKGLYQSRQDFFVITPNHFIDSPFPLSLFKKKYELESYPFEVIYTRAAAAKVGGKGYLEFIREAKSILKSKKPDVIWSQSFWSAKELFDLDIPIICTFHDSCLKQSDWMIDQPNVFYRFISTFQFNNWVKEDWEKEKSFHLYTGMADEEFDFGLPEERDYFLWVAGFNWVSLKKDWMCLLNWPK